MSGVIQCDACGKTYSFQNFNSGIESEYPLIASINIHDSMDVVTKHDVVHGCSRECAIKIAEKSIDRCFAEASAQPENTPPK
jgi:hypothetical protein